MQTIAYINSIDITPQVLRELNVTQFGNYQEYSTLFPNGCMEHDTVCVNAISLSLW